MNISLIYLFNLFSHTDVYIYVAQLYLKGHPIYLSESKVEGPKDMRHSTSDQTGIKHVMSPLEVAPANNKNSISPQENHQNFEQLYVDSNWRKFWPKHSSTSETFFRYNAKPPINEEKIPAQNIPEQIVAECDKDEKSAVNSDPLTQYLENEKKKDKLKPKVIFLYLYLKYLNGVKH